MDKFTSPIRDIRREGSGPFGGFAKQNRRMRTGHRETYTSRLKSSEPRTGGHFAKARKTDNRLKVVEISRVLNFYTIAVEDN
jgi:hypothetical protein